MYHHGPADDACAFQAAGCFCWVGDRMLLICRQAGKPLAGLWGIPTGKLEPGETPRQAIIRELAEEVGLHVPPDAPHEVATAIVEDRGTRFAYITFVLTLAHLPDLKANAEEVDTMDWRTVDELSELRFVPFFHNTLHDALNWRYTGHVPVDPTPRQEREQP